MSIIMNNAFDGGSCEDCHEQYREGQERNGRLRVGVIREGNVRVGAPSLCCPF